MAYSFSRLSKFERCKRSFYYRYIRNIPEISGEAADFGSMVHAALESDDFSQVIKDQAAYAMFINGKKILEGIGKEKIKGKEVKLAIDKKGRATAYEADNAFFRGIIDVLGDDFILDWKTGFKTPSPLQLGMYQILAEANGYYPNKLQYMMLKQDKFETVYATPELFNDSLEWLSKVVSELEDAKEKFNSKMGDFFLKTYLDTNALNKDELKVKTEEIVEEFFNRSTGSQCDYCSYVSICKGSLGDSPQAKLKKIELLKAEQKQLNIEVKKIVLETGKDIIFEDGKHYGNTFKTSFVCKNKKVFQAMLRQKGLLGIDETIDTKSYKSFLEKHPEFTEYFRTSISNSFGYKEFKIIV